MVWPHHLWHFVSELEGFEDMGAVECEGVGPNHALRFFGQLEEARESSRWRGNGGVVDEIEVVCYPGLA